MVIDWDDVIDDLRSWDEVEGFLSGSWEEVRDRVSGVVLERGDRLLVDEPRSATAAQRRRLHRAGFRRVHDGEPCWSWRPPDPEPSDLGPPLPRTMPLRVRMVFEAGRIERARDRARATMTLHVLRDVFGCAPEDLTVVLPVDDGSDFGDDDEDDWLPAADCATLEAACRSAVPPRDERP